MSAEQIFRITDEEKKAIRKHYDRTDAQIKEDIEDIKIWLKKQPHLPQDEDEVRIRSMLIYNKFSIEKTKKKLDIYYSSKNFVPEYFENRAPLENPAISLLMDQLILMPLPNLTPDLHRVTYVRLMGESFNIWNYFKIVFSLLDLRLMYDEAIADRYVMDLKYVKLAQLVQFTPPAIIKTYELLQKAYSDKIAGVHFVNMPSIANTLFLLINSVLSAKLANRVHVHKNLEDLCRELTPKVLPNECGGTAGPIDELYDNWKIYLKSNNDWLKKVGERNSDESKRIGDPFNSGMFGVEGSFRTLSFD